LTPIVIPPALDTITFSPLDKKMAKKQLGFPSDVVVIGYGGGTSGRKGWNFFQQIVSYNFSESSKIAFLVFGTEFFPASISNQNKVIKLGKIQNVEELRLAYSGMDLLLMPSIMDAYGLIAQEAQSCGVPVICFDKTGVADVVDKEVTGVAVRHLNAGAMIHEISTLLKNPERLKAMATSARERATKNWRYDIVSRQYIELYSEILQSES
jgi:glycosyltransferase involved in cell wall biosynthesis